MSDRNYKLIGLLPPDRMVSFFSGEARQENKALGGIDGYTYDGNYYLVPHAVADKIIKLAKRTLSDQDTREELQDNEDSVFLAVWNVDHFKTGFSLIVHGVNGPGEDFANALYDSGSPLRKGLVSGTTLFESSAAHMSWPTSFSATPAETGWRGDADELFHALRSIAHDAPVAQKISSQFNALAGKTVVFTGTLETASREEAEAEARKYGLKVSKSVSAKTDFLVHGTKCGSKLNAAQKLGVTIVSEKHWRALLKA